MMLATNDGETQTRAFMGIRLHKIFVHGLRCP